MGFAGKSVNINQATFSDNYVKKTRPGSANIDILPRGKVMSHVANKLQMPYLTFSIYSSCPISVKSINSCENQIVRLKISSACYFGWNMVAFTFMVKVRVFCQYSNQGFQNTQLCSGARGINIPQLWTDFLWRGCSKISLLFVCF